jgi:hypothetical protein
MRKRLLRPQASRFSSRSAVIRTLSTSFGGWLLSQENTPVSRARSNDGARYGYFSSSVVQYTSLMNFDQLSILDACSE